MGRGKKKYRKSSIKNKRGKGRTKKKIEKKANKKKYCESN